MGLLSDAAALSLSSGSSSQTCEEEGGKEACGSEGAHDARCPSCRVRVAGNGARLTGAKNLLRFFGSAQIEPKSQSRQKPLSSAPDPTPPPPPSSLSALRLSFAHLYSTTSSECCTNFSQARGRAALRRAKLRYSDMYYVRLGNLTDTSCLTLYFPLS